MKRIFLFLSIVLCSLSMTAQSAWLFNRGDSISWQPSQDMTITFEKDPAGFFWQNIQTGSLDVVRMPIYTNDGITFADTPFLQAEKSHFEVTNSGVRRFEIRLKTNISDWNSIICQPQANWLRLIKTNGSKFPIITYTFEYDVNKTGSDLDETIAFSYLHANLLETVEVKSVGGLYLDAIEKDYEVTNSGLRQFQVWLNTNIENWREINCKPQVDWIKLIATSPSSNGDPYVFYDFYYDANYTGSDREGTIIFSYPEAHLSDTVKVKSVGENYDPNSVSEERAVLMDFYKVTDGDNWTRNDNWGSDKPLGDWLGIRTNEDGHVSKIIIDLNELGGNMEDIIDVLTGLPYLEELSLTCNFRIRGHIPASIGKLKSLRDLTLSHLPITGEIPEEIGQLTNLRNLYMAENGLTGKIPESIVNLKNLFALVLLNNQLSGPIPKDIGKMSQLELINLRNNQLTGTIPESMGDLKKLVYLLLSENQLEGGMPTSFAKLSNLHELSLYHNNMDGEIPAEVANTEMWSHLAYMINPQNEGHEIRCNDYKSTDYSQDGKVTLLSRHTKGNGIKVAIVGDAYSDRLIADGTYESCGIRAMESFFSIEPYTTYRDYFDVYLVTAVSENERIGANTSFDVKTDGSFIRFSPEKVIDFLTKVPDFNGSLENITTILFENLHFDLIGFRDQCVWFSDGFAIGTCSTGASMENTIHHEANGHGFGKLADEYYTDDEYGTNRYPESEYETLDKLHQEGQFLNIDYHSDPSSVVWKDFISNSDYAVENIGVFEGGMGDYSKGIYRPTENSVMWDTSRTFNAPSRWAIYQRIMKLAGEECKFEDFLAYDKKNLENLRRSGTRAKTVPTRHVEEIRGAQHLGAKPIMYNYPSSEVGMHK